MTTPGFSDHHGTRTNTTPREHPTTIVIAGASGFIGQYLQARWRARGHRVATIGRSAATSRRPDATWDDPDALVQVLDGADLLVNLAGRSVSCRYTKRNADAIFASRTETTAALGRALSRAANPPALWVNASTGTIYRDSRDRPMDEVDGELGTGFSVAVAQAWEHELAAATVPANTRRVALRMSIVLGAGGALAPFINLARIGFGGAQGDGGQRFSWVHVEDVARTIEFLTTHPEITGPVNVAAPQVVTNGRLMSHVREAFGTYPWAGAGARTTEITSRASAPGSRRNWPGIPLPTWSLTFGAAIIRTETELVLKSRWVDSAKLREAGFAFAHPQVGPALADIAATTRRGLLPVQLG